MYFFPYGVDVPMERWPITNFTILGLIILAFVGQGWAMFEGGIGAIEPFVLSGWNPQGLFGHMWLHGGILHLVGNVVFLWVFGNAICAKFGNLHFALFYVSAGLLAAFTHLLSGGGPAIGASGAINGVVGAFLVLYPLNNVSCVFGFFIWFRWFRVSSIWIILLYFAFDIWGALTGAGGVGYFAHLGGFAAGFGVATLALKMNWIEMTRAEVSIYDLRNRRRNRNPAPYRPAQPSPEQQRPADVARPPTPTSRPSPSPRFKSYLDEQRGQPPKSGVGNTEQKAIRFRCSCGKVLRADAWLAGKRARCPDCSTVLEVPRQTP